MEAIRGNPRAILGANRYCATLVEHVQKPEPLLDLGKLALTLRPANKAEKERLAYVLWEAGRSALVESRLESAKELIASAKALRVDGVSDYHSLDRSEPWKSPFEKDKGLAKLLADLESGALDAAQHKVKGRSAKAGKAGKVILRLSDKALGDLAGVEGGDPPLPRFGAWDHLGRFQ